MADNEVARDDGLGIGGVDTRCAMYRATKGIDAGKYTWFMEIANSQNFDQIFAYMDVVDGARADNSIAPATSTRAGIVWERLWDDGPTKVPVPMLWRPANETRGQVRCYAVQGYA